MKTKLFILLAAFAMSISACQKESDDEIVTETPEKDYQPVTAGSTWKYSSVSGETYTETAAGDTTIDGEKFHIIKSDENGDRYVNKSNGIYKTRGYVDIEEINQFVDLIYLKDAAAGTTWTETENITYNSFTIPVTFKYTIASRESEKVVNGITYKDVIGVDMVVSANSILIGGNMDIATGRQFYAKGVGNISGSLTVDFQGASSSDSTYLVSSDIKE